MMKNLLFVYICLFGLALPLSAQKLDAQDILDRTATAFRQAGGIQAEFYGSDVCERCLQGVLSDYPSERRKVPVGCRRVKTWFDGRTQWSYLTNSDEVTFPNLLLKSCKVSILMPCCLFTSKGIT